MMIEAWCKWPHGVGGFRGRTVRDILFHTDPSVRPPLVKLLDPPLRRTCVFACSPRLPVCLQRQAHLSVRLHLVFELRLFGQHFFHWLIRHLPLSLHIAATEQNWTEMVASFPSRRCDPAFSSWQGGTEADACAGTWPVIDRLTVT